MKTMPCPLNGPRNITEFVCAGEMRVMPDPAAMSDAEWADFVFMETNGAGIVREWWCHVPTSYWFIAERNTVTDEILRTYPASDVFTARRGFAQKPSP
jgi:sarcosine oxidase, subunit delta